MGGGPVTKNFRGADVDPMTYDFLMELAQRAGSLYIDAIDGYGSYRSNDSSGGTDTGGGHVDINAEKWTDAQARWVETLARQQGGCAYFRPRSWYSDYYKKWITPGWQRHVHILVMGVPDLSSAAKVQVQEYKDGYNGLVGNDLDTGNRNYTHMTWPLYLKENEMQPNDIVPGSSPAITWAQAALRGNHAYNVVIEGGNVDKRIDGVYEALNALSTKVANLPATASAAEVVEEAIAEIKARLAE